MEPKRLLRLRLLALGWIAACSGQASPEMASSGTPPVALAPPRTVELPFAVADLAKPRMDGEGGPNALDPYQAPLIYFEVRHDEPARGIAEPAQVAFRETLRTLANATQVREVHFAWTRSAEGGPQPQGLRVTYDATGKPAAILIRPATDVAPEQSTPAALYLSNPLAAALDQGPALPTEFTLAGTFETGPMAMGPYVYAPSGSSDLIGLHCRCDPVQAEATRTVVEYELIPDEAIGDPVAGDAALDAFLREALTHLQ